MIGLVDYDIQQFTSTASIIPNLEIMKLASYYKTEERKFCNLISLKDEDLDQYEKIFFFSETSTNIQIPKTFLEKSNVIYGGCGFTGKYVAFENSLIDFALPTINIYQNFLKHLYSIGIKMEVINQTLNNTYYRMYANNSKLPIPPINHQNKILLYDKDIFAADGVQIIKEIAKRRPRSIVTIHPIRCKNLTQYFKVVRAPENRISRAAEIILDLNIPLEEISYLLLNYKQLFLADMVKNSNVYITLGEDFNSNARYFKDFIYKCNLLYSFWSQGILIKIKYIYPTIGYNNPLQNLSLAVAKWSQGTGKDKRTLEEALVTRLAQEKKELYAQEKNLLLKFYPSAVDLFKQTQPELIAKGAWKI